MADKMIGSIVLFENSGRKIAGIVFSKKTRKRFLGKDKLKSKESELFIRVLGSLGKNMYLFVDEKEINILCSGNNPNCILSLLTHQEEYFFQLLEDYREVVAADLQFLLAFMISNEDDLLLRIPAAFFKEFKAGIGYTAHQKRVRVMEKKKKSK